jgi:aminomethyltransferase
MALKRTPLYERHRDLGARLVEFGGWEMPVQYTSILDEHRAVRERAGLFDVSHMGEIRVTGPAALRWLRRMITNDPADLDVGQAQYTMLCYPGGGVVDDLIVYRVDDESYLLVVNASNTDKDFAWLHEQLTGDVELENISAERGLLALQGPAAAEILQRLTGVDLSELAYYHVTAGDVVGREVTRIPAWIARTGYTGEDGFEIMVGSDRVVELWDALLGAGADEGLVPVGLGARDTLRLEAAMPLYGHELDADTNPLEAGLSYFVKLDKPDFVGRDALVQAKASGLDRKLIGFELRGRGIARQGYAIRHAGTAVGTVTSGTYAPYLERAIGMGFVPPEVASPGTEIEVMVRGRPVAAEIVKRPFYRRQRR